MTITVYKQKTTNKIFLIQKKIPKKDGDFFLQNHEMRPKIESRNSGEHELRNHEMRGSPVFTYTHELRTPNEGIKSKKSGLVLKSF